jgi:hypothetical protein
MDGVFDPVGGDKLEQSFSFSLRRKARNQRTR